MTPDEFISKWFDDGTRGTELAKADLDSVIAAAVIAERERCAKECEEFGASPTVSPSASRAMLSCAAAIRALK